jgi:hypothetical protein
VSADLNTFLPDPDISKRHSVLVHAPAEVVFQTARGFDMTSVPLIRTIFQMRAQVLGARAGPTSTALTSEDLLRLGWATLAEEPGRLFVAGAACRPWLADVVFTPVPPDQFGAYAEPGRVKIAWTLEAEPLGYDRSRLTTETRAAGTDAEARRRFRSYWRIFGIGIVAIRWLLLPAIRREAERRWRAAAPRPT